MSFNFIIQGEKKTLAVVKVSTVGTTRKVTHLKVSDRGDEALGLNCLYAILVTQAQRNGLGEAEAIEWADERLIELEWIEGVHPDMIMFEDLKYLLANLSSLANPTFQNVTLASDLDLEPILEELEIKEQDLSDPNTPVDEPEPFYSEVFFNEATQAIREGRYQGWWSPVEREMLPIGAPGGAGKVEEMGFPDEEDMLDMEEDTLDIVEGNFNDLGISKDHHILYVGDNQVLAWKPEATQGLFIALDYDRYASMDEEPFSEVVEGFWRTIEQGHELIWMGKDRVLDWVPAETQSSYRVWRYDPWGDREGDEVDELEVDVFPPPALVEEKVWESIDEDYRLIYLGGDRVLGWVPETGDLRIWPYVEGGGNPLARREVKWNWKTIRAGHQIVNLGGDRVLVWKPSTGWFRIYRYDRTISGEADPFPGAPIVEGHWEFVNENNQLIKTYQLIWLGGDRILGWHPETGDYRIWRYDRMVTSADPLT